jgi:hypothetical protein
VPFGEVIGMPVGLWSLRYCASEEVRPPSAVPICKGEHVGMEHEDCIWARGPQENFPWLCEW